MKDMCERKGIHTSAVWDHLCLAIVLNYFVETEDRHIAIMFDNRVQHDLEQRGFQREVFCY